MNPACRSSMSSQGEAVLQTTTVPHHSGQRKEGRNIPPARRARVDPGRPAAARTTRGRRPCRWRAPLGPAAAPAPPPRRAAPRSTACPARTCPSSMRLDCQHSWRWNSRSQWRVRRCRVALRVRQPGCHDVARRKNKGHESAAADVVSPPSAEAVFEVLGGAEAGEAAGGHDADARAQRLALLHAVTRQQHRVACVSGLHRGILSEMSCRSKTARHSSERLAQHRKADSTAAQKGDGAGLIASCHCCTCGDDLALQDAPQEVARRGVHAYRTVRTQLCYWASSAAATECSLSRKAWPRNGMCA